MQNRLPAAGATARQLRLERGRSQDVLADRTSPRKRGRVPEYVCYRHRHYGTCANTRHTPAAEMNAAVLQAIEDHALTPEAIEQVIVLTERDD